MSLFTVNRHVGTTTYWRCKNRRICGSTITTTTATDAIQDSKKAAHSHHGTHLVEIANRRKVLQLKHSVVQDIHRPLKRLFSEAFAGEEEDPERAAATPSFASLKATLYRETECGVAEVTSKSS